MEGYIFSKKFCTIKKTWDGLPGFTQEAIYHVRTEMRESLNNDELMPRMMVHVFNIHVNKSLTGRTRWPI